jgi:hypothetical protein
MNRWSLRSQARFSCRDRALALAQCGPDRRAPRRRSRCRKTGPSRIGRDRQLRKDKPHPVTPLPNRAQFGKHGLEDRRLRGHEALQVEGIARRHLEFSLFVRRARTGERQRPLPRDWRSPFRIWKPAWTPKYRRGRHLGRNEDPLFRSAAGRNGTVVATAGAARFLAHRPKPTTARATKSRSTRSNGSGFSTGSSLA